MTDDEGLALAAAKKMFADRKAQEATVSLERLVGYWSGNTGPWAPEESLWGEALRLQALDLGLGVVWEGLPKKGKPLALADLEQTLSALSRRGVDLGQAHLLVEAGEPDVFLSVPRAFPDLGIMPKPDPRKVGLLR